MRIFSLIAFGLLLSFCAREETVWPIVKQSIALMPDSSVTHNFISIQDSTDTIVFNYSTYFESTTPLAGSDNESAQTLSQTVICAGQNLNTTLKVSLTSLGLQQGDKLIIRNGEDICLALHLKFPEIFTGENTELRAFFVVEDDTIPDVIIGHCPDNENLSKLVYVVNLQGRANINFIESNNTIYRRQ
jgi:hypothetical protein